MEVNIAYTYSATIRKSILVVLSITQLKDTSKAYDDMIFKSFIHDNGKEWKLGVFFCSFCEGCCKNQI